MFWKRGWWSKPVESFDGYRRIWVGERSDGSVFWNTITTDTEQGIITTLHHKQLAKFYINHWLNAPFDAKSVGCFDLAIMEASFSVRHQVSTMVGQGGA